MKKTIIFYSFLIIGIIAIPFLRNSQNAMAATISDKLKSEGFPMDFQIKDKEICITLTSRSEQKQIEPWDILALRRGRTEARAYTAQSRFGSVSDVLTEVIVNAKGETIYEASLNDALIVHPEITSSALLDSKLEFSEEDILIQLENLFSSDDLKIDVLSVSPSLLGGSQAELEWKGHNNNYVDINEQIPKIQALVESLNENGMNITEYTLTVKSDQDKILLLLSADLLYRDFLWWQSPEFEQQTWTKSSPAPIAQ